MKTSEMITKYADRITESMIDAYRKVLDSKGRCQYKIYIWEDGEIERLLGVAGDNTYLSPRDGEKRELFYVTTVACRGFDPWDIADHPAPENDSEREAEEAEIIDYCMDEYRLNIDDTLDDIIRDADTVERG